MLYQPSSETNKEKVLRALSVAFADTNKMAGWVERHVSCDIELMITSRVLTCAVALAVTTSAAFALPIIGASAGIEDPDVIQDFGPAHFLSPVSDIDVTNQYPGLTFLEGWQYLPGFDDVQDGFTGSFLGNPRSTPETRPDAPDTATVVFANPIVGASFLLRTNTGDTTFTAALGGSVVETFSALTDGAPDTSNVYGFTDIVFDSIVINAPINNAFEFDHLTYRFVEAPTATPVPEPTTIALLSIGLLSLLLLNRRRAP